MVCLLIVMILSREQISSCRQIRNPWITPYAAYPPPAPSVPGRRGAQWNASWGSPAGCFGLASFQQWEAPPVEGRMGREQGQDKPSSFLPLLAVIPCSDSSCIPVQLQLQQGAFSLVHFSVVSGNTLSDLIPQP